MVGLTGRIKCQLGFWVMQTYDSFTGSEDLCWTQVNIICTDYRFQVQTKPMHNINLRQHTDYNSLRMTQIDASLQATLVLVLAVQIIGFKCRWSLRTTSTRVSIQTLIVYA